MKSFLRLLASALFAVPLLVACGGGGEPFIEPAPPPEPDPPPQESVCSPARQRESLVAWMQENYYWTPQAGNAAAPSQDAFFRSLLAPADRYSYSDSAANDLLSVLGRRIGWGYTLVWADAAQTVMKMRNIEPKGPLARAGVSRGDTVLSIDGYAPAQVAAGTPGAVTATGVVRVFRLRNAAGAERTLSLPSEQFELSAVPATATFNVTRTTGTGTETVRAGYIAYQQFATYGFIDIGDAIKSMTAAGVKELVLDLRYNGGGSVNVARDLASMIGGERTKDQVFAQLRFNSGKAASNYDLRFAKLAAALPAPPLQGLSRVFVLASAATASASELVINGLRPWMPVVLIGETTYGKPYGFTPRESCGLNYNAVNFEIFNALGAGGYVNGMAPDCSAPDDLAHQLGDPLEGRTRAAVYYMANGRCESQVPQAFGVKRPVQAFGEIVPPGMYAR